mmetsp:Transcript_32841/g.45607  ORF Transcript_32841/g.45607 Transcript_32841/m.45607 type:complete len:191 (+) Transcript_32841:181-753(+)
MHLSKTSGLEGFEYAVHPGGVPPHLFIVLKQQRLALPQVGGGDGGVSSAAPHTPPLLGVFYVLDGTIYPGPSLHAVLQTRTLRCIHSVREAFRTLSAALTTSSVEASCTTDSPPTPPRSPRSMDEERLMDAIILGALETPPEQCGTKRSLESNEEKEKTPDTKTSIQNEVKREAEDLNTGSISKRVKLEG